MLVARAPSARGGMWCVYACWEWGCLRVLRAWGRLGLIRLAFYGSRHLYDRAITRPPTVLPASHGDGLRDIFDGRAYWAQRADVNHVFGLRSLMLALALYC